MARAKKRKIAYVPAWDPDTITDSLWLDDPEVSTETRRARPNNDLTGRGYRSATTDEKRR